MFFSIQLWVVEVAEKQCTHGYGTFIGRFSYENNKQKVVMKDFVHRYSTGDDGIRVGIDKNEKGEIIYPISKLQPYGINSLETTFNALNRITQPLSLPAFKNKNSYILKNITIFA